MARKLCDLCQEKQASKMRFGVTLCKDCYDGFDKALKGDAEAINRFAHTENFPYATEAAQKHVILFLAKQNGISDVIQQQEQRIQRTIEKDKKREAYAQSIGVSYKDLNKDKINDLYADIGKKIKMWVKWIFLVEALAIIVVAITMMVIAESASMVFIGSLVIIFGVMFAWIGSWLMYAFGELVDKTTTNEKNTRNILKIMLENNAKQ